ncbi:MAG: discoidin domain-containing protein [Archangium sp.]
MIMLTPVLLLAAAAGPDVNMLALEAGTVIVDSSPSYGGAWTAEALADGSASTGFCGPQGTKGPFFFTFELEQRSVLTSVEIDNTGDEEPSYPGISAASVEVWVSGAQTDQAQKVATVKVPRAGKARFALPKDTLGRFVKLVVPGNHGNPSYTELMEVAVMGHPLEPTPSPTRNIAGMWSLDDGVIRIAADGATVTGCVLRKNDAQRFRGTIAGHVAKVTLEGLDRTRGSATMVVTADATRLRGRYQLGGFGTWTATRKEGALVDCDAMIAQAALARRLDAARDSLVLMGVGFAANDEVALEANDDLSSIVALLHDRPTARVQFTVLGKTDGAPDELKRTERRATALANALLKKGVPPERVEIGFGLMKWPAVKPEPRVEARWKVD